MEVFGTIAAAVDLIQKIKATFDQAKTNRREGFIISGEIIDSLLRIQNLLKQYSLINSPALRNDLSEFENGLRATLVRRERLIRSRGEGFWDRSVTWCKEAYYSGDIKDELAELRQRIQTCHQNLQVQCAIRIDDGVANANARLDVLHTLFSENQKILGRIEHKMGEQISEAEHDSERAQVLVGLRKMTVEQASQSLKDTKETLQFSSLASDMETNYLRLKVKALTEALPKIREERLIPYEARPLLPDDRIKWTTYHTEIGNQDLAQEDSVQELIRILRILRSESAISQMDIAADLCRLGLTLGDLDMWEERMEIDAWVVQIRRELSRSGDPDSEVNLAVSLHNLSISLSEAGKFMPSLDASRESVSICREWVKDEPELCLSQLASSLDRLSYHMYLLGQHEDAGRCAEEAVGIYRKLAEDDWESFFGDLASSLDCWALCLSENRKDEDTIKVAEEAVGIYRMVAKDQPTISLPGIAVSLNNLSWYLILSGFLDAALRASEESIDSYRTLVRDQPRLFLPGLAGSLGNLSIVLYGLGRYSDAHKVSEESIAIYHELVKEKSRGHLPYLTLYLTTMSLILQNLGRYESALSASEQSIDVYQKLIKTQVTPSFLCQAFPTHVLACSLVKLSRYQDALTKVEEALHLLSDSAKPHDPELYQSTRCKFLNTQSVCLSHLDRHNEAIMVGREGLEMSRLLQTKRPRVYSSILARNLLDLSRALHRMGEFIVARGIVEESLGYYRNLAHDLPLKYNSELKEALLLLSAVLTLTGDSSGAREADFEASRLC